MPGAVVLLLGGAGQLAARLLERVEREPRAVEPVRARGAELVGRSLLRRGHVERPGGHGGGVRLGRAARCQRHRARHGEGEGTDGAEADRQRRDVCMRGHAQPFVKPPAKDDLSGSDWRRRPAAHAASPRGTAGVRPSRSTRVLHSCRSTLVDQSSGTAAGLGVRPDRPAAVAGACRPRGSSRTDCRIYGPKRLCVRVLTTAWFGWTGAVRRYCKWG